jgi:hypothetical protein
VELSDAGEEWIEGDDPVPQKGKKEGSEKLPGGGPDGNKDTPPLPGQDGEGTGEPSENGKVIDGDTDYGDEIDATQGEAESDVSQDSDMGDEVGDIIGDYYGSIQN